MDHTYGNHGISKHQRIKKPANLENDLYVKNPFLLAGFSFVYLPLERESYESIFSILWPAEYIVVINRIFYNLIHIHTKNICPVILLPLFVRFHGYNSVFNPPGISPYSVYV